MSLLRRVAQASAVGYAICFVLWRLLVDSSLYAKWWPLQISDIFALLALAPLPCLILAGVIWRSRLLWLALLIPSVWFGYNYGQLLVPPIASVAKAKSDQDSLRLLTFNTK